MALRTIFYGLARAPFPGINNSALQEMPIVCDIVDAMADDDTAALVLPATGDLGMPPRLVQVYRHTGGDLTSGAAATFVLSTGATLEFQIDPNNRNDAELRGQIKVTHTMTGLSAGAATAVQIAASINADTNLSPWIRAVAGLTTNAVTLFPVLSNSTLLNTTNVTAARQLAALEGSQFPAFSIIGGTAQAVAAFAFPAGKVGYPTRTYQSQTGPVLTAGTGWSFSYAAATRTLTIQNETGGTVNRVCALVWQ